MPCPPVAVATAPRLLHFRPGCARCAGQGATEGAVLCAQLEAAAAGTAARHRSKQEKSIRRALAKNADLARFASSVASSEGNSEGNGEGTGEGISASGITGPVNGERVRSAARRVLDKLLRGLEKGRRAGARTADALLRQRSRAGDVSGKSTSHIRWRALLV